MVRHNPEKGMMRMATQDQSKQNQQNQQSQQSQQVDKLIATCDDCCNKLRQLNDCEQPLKDCENLRNELSSAKNKQGAEATVGGVAAIDWQSLLVKAFSILQAVLQILSSSQKE